MKKLIDEKNEIDNNNFILSQPHDDSYLKNSWHNSNMQLNTEKYQYSSRIIRSESNLSLNKRITLFEKFQRIINGGTLFLEKNNREELADQELVKNLFESKIKVFSLKDCFIG